MTTQLDPSLIGSRVQPLQIADLLETRAQLQMRRDTARRQQMADQQTMQDRDRAEQDRQLTRDVGSAYAGGDEAGGRKKALEAGNFALIKQLDEAGDEGRKRAFDISQHTAPLLLSLGKLPDEQRVAGLRQIAPQLQQSGFTRDHIEQLATTPGALGNDALQGYGNAAMTIAEYNKAHEPYTLGQDQKRFDGDNNLIASGPESIKAVTTPEGGTTTILGGAGHTGIAGGASPVANAKTVAEGLFPGVRVTDNRRDPNSKLGRANPGSWHVRSGGAVDVAPIKGMDFDQYVQGYRDAGYEIIEARDEVKNPSVHATGPHWHVVIGGKPEAGAMVIQGKPKQPSLAEDRAERRASSTDQKNMRTATVTLRKEFDALPEVKSFKILQTARNQVRALSKPNNTAADDVGLIFSFMRMLDPNSVVREGEFATAANSASIPDRIRNQYNRALDGTRLTAEQRFNMMGAADKAYRPARDKYNQVAQQYYGYARDSGISPSSLPPTYRDKGGARPGAPAAAVAYLKKNPTLSAQFDQMYGNGSAAKALGR